MKRNIALPTLAVLLALGAQGCVTTLSPRAVARAMVQQRSSALAQDTCERVQQEGSRGEEDGLVKYTLKSPTDGVDQLGCAFYVGLIPDDSLESGSRLGLVPAILYVVYDGNSAGKLVTVDSLADGTVDYASVHFVGKTGSLETRKVPKPKLKELRVLQLTTLEEYLATPSKNTI